MGDSLGLGFFGAKAHWTCVLRLHPSITPSYKCMTSVPFRISGNKVDALSLAMAFAVGLFDIVFFQWDVV